MHGYQLTYYTKVNNEKKCWVEHDRRCSVAVKGWEGPSSSTSQGILQFFVPLLCCNVET